MLPRADPWSCIQPGASRNLLINLVPAVRIELTTYRLQCGCSTAELSRPRTVIAEPANCFKKPRRAAFGLNSVPDANVVQPKPIWRVQWVSWPGSYWG